MLRLALLMSGCSHQQKERRRAQRRPAPQWSLEAEHWSCAISSPPMCCLPAAAVQVCGIPHPPSSSAGWKHEGRLWELQHLWNDRQPYTTARFSPGWETWAVLHWCGGNPMNQGRACPQEGSRRQELVLEGLVDPGGVGMGPPQILLKLEMFHRSMSVPTKCFMGNVTSFWLSCVFSITSKMFHFAKVKMFPLGLIISTCVVLASELGENTSFRVWLYKVHMLSSLP